MRKEVVLKKVRDLVATLAVLVVLFGMIMVINPRVHERFAELTSSVHGGESLGPVQNAAYAAMSVGSDYAADNPFLFSFLVVAVVLFMLMVRS
jgi:ribose/xylose/arabinose/galactoside ABC-type transport system permease subunit